jgi:hypothetical protein
MTAFLGIAPVEPSEVVVPDATARHARGWEGTIGGVRRAALAARFERRLDALGLGYSLRRAPGT